MSLTIHTHDLIKSYRNRTVVNHVSVEVKQGEIVGLLGPNGAGKTTTFYMVVGLIRPDEGKVFLNEEDITRQPMYKRAQMGLGYLPQEASVFRKLTVEDNIKAILEMTKLSKKVQKDKLESLLDEFGLQHVRKNNGDSLSGGERRRTEIARALAVDPKFILLDEPFAGVDPIAVEDIQTVVARLKTKNIGILITDHNVNETLSICDRAYLLIEGKIFKQGTAEELAADEQVRRLYLGRNFELKRKDYLHDEVRTDLTLKREISHDKLNAALGSGVQMAQKIVDTPITISHIKNLREFDDLNIKDFFQFADELKKSLIDFAEKNNRPKIKETALQLPAYKLSDFTGSSFARILPGGIGDIVAFQNQVGKLDSAIREVQSYFSKLALYVENEEFEKTT
ncbi:MAG TPA: LPS export ABC transporter ATP-binding protein [Chitinophagaceae bacterium]|nr:LPS export ABC transporter ATP-binding protein [Chitinophagaceae bacterium]